jgi:hypothetical protein
MEAREVSLLAEKLTMNPYRRLSFQKSNGVRDDESLSPTFLSEIQRCSQRCTSVGYSDTQVDVIGHRMPFH